MGIIDATFSAKLQGALMTDNVTRLKKTPAPLPFAPGDVVALNRGGALMTVRKRHKDTVEVDSLSDRGELQSGSFPALMLYGRPVAAEEAA
jgi:hypothetical protein